MTEGMEKESTKMPEPPPTAPEIRPIKKYMAELVGTMVLVLIGCGSVVTASIASMYLGGSGVDPIFYVEIAFALASPS